MSRYIRRRHSEKEAGFNALIADYEKLHALLVKRMTPSSGMLGTMKRLKNRVHREFRLEKLSPEFYTTERKKKRMQKEMEKQKKREEGRREREERRRARKERRKARKGKDE